MGGIDAQRGGAPNNRNSETDIWGRAVFCAWVSLLARGYLYDGAGAAGLSCLNGNNDVSNANWNILARNSG